MHGYVYHGEPVFIQNFDDASEEKVADQSRRKKRVRKNRLMEKANQLENDSLNLHDNSSHKLVGVDKDVQWMQSFFKN